MSRQTLERDQARVVGDHEDAIPKNGHAAIDAGYGVPGWDQAFGALPAVVPDLCACACVEGEGLIGGGDVHDSIDDEGGCLERAMRAWKGEDPFGGEAGDVRYVDGVQRAVAIAADVAVVGGPFA